MNIIKKVISAALLAFSALGLTISPLAFADGKSDAEATCPGCHGIVINGIQAVGTGGKACAQRTAAEWITTIERMNGKGCGVPAGSIAGIASYLAIVGSSSTTTSSTTTTTFVFTCRPYFFSVFPSSLSFTATQGGVPPASQSLSVSFGNALRPPQWSITSSPAWLSVTPTGGTGSGRVTVSIPSTQLEAGTYTGSISFVSYVSGCSIPTPSAATVSFTVEPSTSTTTTSTTTTTLGGINILLCYNQDGSSFIGYGTCPAGTSSTPPPTCISGLPTFDGSAWICPTTTTTSTTSTTTTSSTTTTTLCNTYVNGTTQYPYSGSGSCHSFANDDVTGVHIVRDQAYCKKHMSHFNSKGNHVHTYPHPMCM